MSCYDNMRISAYEPIVEGIMTISWSLSGWCLQVRHRHSCGRLSDCGVDTYDKLTLSELEDVLPTVVDLWGPLSEGRLAREVARGR